MTTRSNNGEAFGCSTPNSPPHKSGLKTDFPLSPSTSDPLLYQQEIQHKTSVDLKDFLTTPLQESNNAIVPETAGANGQKRKHTDAGHQVSKRYKSTELNSTAAICTGSQPNTLEQDIQLDPTPAGRSPEASNHQKTPTDPIQYWAHNQTWPEDFANMNQEQTTSSKRRASSSSYTQRYKVGAVPEAYSAAYEIYLREHGIVMEESAGRSRVSKESKSLYERLLRGVHERPDNTMFPISQFLFAWERAQNRNEARVFRDITPLLVPSPELLNVSGHEELQNLVEEISVEWTGCKTLAGPRPKPDFAVGLAASALSKDEMAKLKNYASPEQPAAFTDDLYFPFVLCEVKCGDQGIRRADRQNMHSSSIAASAINKLNATLGPGKKNALDGETLVYSISHDNERVKIYGHLIHQGAFYRYPIASFVLNFEENIGWKRTHDFFREVYHLVYPVHLKRIQEALAAMPDPRNVSVDFNMSSELGDESEPQELDPSVRSSQENSTFKKPDIPASKKQKSEIALLQEQMAEQQKQSKEQTMSLEKQLAMLLEQMAEQQKQSREQILFLQKQITEQTDRYREPPTQNKERS